MLPETSPTLDQQLSALGARLRALRKMRALTQVDLAARAGVSTRTLRSLESGEDVHLSTLLRVMRALGHRDLVDRLVPAATPSPIALADALKAAQATRGGSRDE